MNRPRLLFTAALCVASLLPTSAATIVAQGRPWEKPYDQWTLKETEQILTDSPWAQTRSKGVALDSLQLGIGINNPPDAEGVTLRLRSSPVIRLAMLRHRQIKEKFEKMDEKAKAAFMEKNRPLLECQPCRDYYVVTLHPPPGAQKGVPVSLRSTPLATLKQSIRLFDERGERRDLLHFEAPKTGGDEATFFFARTNDKGEPLLTPNSRLVAVTLDPQIFAAAVVQLTKFQFDVPQMILKGAVMF